VSWTTPRDWTTGEIVTAAMLNINVRDNTLALAHPLLYEQTTRDVVNTTAETTLASVIVPSGVSVPFYLAVDIWGDLLYDATVDSQMTLRLKVGTTTVVSVARTFTTANDRNASRKGMWSLGRLFVNGTNVVGWLYMLYEDPRFNEGGRGSKIAAATATNITVPGQTFSLTAQWSAASTAASWRSHADLITMARP
jgi:hypothetical protein